MPVAAIARQTGRLQAEHSAHLAGADIGNQTFEPRALDLAGTRTSEIFVNDLDLLESELAGLIGQAVLPPLALQVIRHLDRGGLANVHDRPALQMIPRYLRVHE